MISFLLQEGVITIGTISGIFTALLLNSLKQNIIDPIVEKTCPTPIPSNFKSPPNDKNDKQQTENAFSVNALTNQFGGPSKTCINWKLFLRDFVTWFVIMVILYLVWKYIVQPYKTKLNLNTPIVPMGMGKSI
jgi:large-conductance mechanosensitive channel